jgi:hypothetical protein
MAVCGWRYPEWLKGVRAESWVWDNSRSSLQCPVREDRLNGIEGRHRYKRCPFKRPGSQGIKLMGQKAQRANVGPLCLVVHAAYGTIGTLTPMAGGS